MKVSAKYLRQFDAVRDGGERVTEPPEDFAARMQDTVLPNWPSEILIEWFHRHAGHISQYAHLGFERFKFNREVWPLCKIPGRESFRDPRFCDDFNNIQTRASNPNDWLAKYMQSHGTWNTPIVLLRVFGSTRGRKGVQLRRPLHLLEGHRRLAFLVGLRSLGRASSEHNVWVVNLDRCAV